MKVSNGKFEKNRESGTSLLEFAILVALIAIAVVSSVRTLGSGITNKFFVAEAEIGAGGFTGPCNPSHPTWPAC